MTSYSAWEEIKKEQAQEKCGDCGHGRELHTDWYEICNVKGCTCLEFVE